MDNSQIPFENRTTSTEFYKVNLKKNKNIVFLEENPNKKLINLKPNNVLPEITKK